MHNNNEYWCEIRITPNDRESLIALTMIKAGAIKDCVQIELKAASVEVFHAETNRLLNAFINQVML